MNFTLEKNVSFEVLFNLNISFTCRLFKKKTIRLIVKSSHYNMLVTVELQEYHQIKSVDKLLANCETSQE